MKTIGFAISGKENERRRALLPGDMHGLHHCELLYFEVGYGVVLGIPDSTYEETGAHVVSQREVYQQDVVCCVKAPTITERDLFRGNQVLWGWLHLGQDVELREWMERHSIIGMPWEDMYEQERYVFWHNREISGEAGILHALAFLGKAPYECKAALIGRGRVARGAARVMAQLGVEVVTYDRQTVFLLRGEIGNYDLIVNAVLWDMSRTDYLIYRSDLAKMKFGAMIVDISCDIDGAIESSHPTTFENPVFIVDGILHYAVDHTPSLFYRTVSESISSVVSQYVDGMCER